MLIESGTDESAGIYLDGDKIVIWSPGDENLINFCDEDEMNSINDYNIAVKAYIDGDGYLYQLSDSTRKEEIKTIVSALHKISQIRGVEYMHKQIQAENGKSDSKLNKESEKNAGFLAQEVEAVFPMAVKTNTSGIKYVNYQALIPVLVEAVKEQQTQISEQQEQILLMQKQLKQLEETVNALTAKKI